MNKFTLVAVAAFAIATGAKAQVAINTDGTAPNASSMLHVKSTTKGLLIPSMTTTQRDNISSPANGLMIYNTSTKSFWYYKSGAGNGWTEIGSGGLTYPIDDTANSLTPLVKITNEGDNSSIVGAYTGTGSSVYAIQGIVSSTTPGGFSTGLRGVNNGTGGLGVGVYGSQAGSGWGVYGVTPDGLGVYGNSSASGYGVYANSNNGTGLNASSVNGVAANISIYNNSNNNNALTVNSVGNGDIINATTSGSGDVVNAVTTGSGKGVFASTGSGFAVQGVTSNISSAGVIGDNNGGGEAIVGRNTSDIAGAVVGRNDGGGYGVRGFIATSTAGTGIGVYGQVGLNSSTGHAAKFENANSSNAENVVEVAGGGAGHGIHAAITGTSSGSAAVYGTSNYSSGNGVLGEADGSNAYGIWGKSINGYAGFFNGKVTVIGTLAKSSGTFKIDHPQDPANKYLIHSFVESPDMMNVYNGNITTDANGTALVSLPSYFEAENIDFKYQLTVMGQQFAQAIVSREVSGNQFEIRTDKPNVKVSWQVTGVRNDKFAQQNRVVAEVDKAPEERGYYLNPKENGQPETKSMEYAYGKIVPEKSKVQRNAKDNAAVANLPSSKVAETPKKKTQIAPATIPTQEAPASEKN